MRSVRVAAFLAVGALAVPNAFSRSAIAADVNTKRVVAEKEWAELVAHSNADPAINDPSEGLCHFLPRLCITSTKTATGTASEDVLDSTIETRFNDTIVNKVNVAGTPLWQWTHAKVRTNMGVYWWGATPFNAESLNIAVELHGYGIIVDTRPPYVSEKTDGVSRTYAGPANDWKFTVQDTLQLSEQYLITVTKDQDGIVRVNGDLYNVEVLTTYPLPGPFA